MDSHRGREGPRLTHANGRSLFGLSGRNPQVWALRLGATAAGGRRATLRSVSRVCIYHAGCPDGFGAAWAVWRTWGDEARYVPRGHDDPLRERQYRGATVVFVDIAPPVHSLRGLGEEARELIVLDHHVSSLKRISADPELLPGLRSAGHKIHFDLEHSGAVLAWQHFHPDAEVPELLRYVEDQDLWRWKLPATRDVNAAVTATPRTFAAWEELAATPLEDLAAEGAPISRANHMDVERAVSHAHPISLGPHRVEAVNARVQRSQIGHELALRAAYGAPCGAVYRLTGRRVDVSIYSVGDFDVAELAATWGGGGHRNAGGFSVTLAEWLADFA